ncbi:F-box/WD repeat-containing protein 4 isoform X2 [Mastacembelus armatus]|uniref:F-box/WD repeat-containing protein 4 isoform X2 n=1 Tax=Mastacembelus armatus TaxID=205130 RepID=UPI000E454681|nr:F-box/WD repeat-containing protein 4 isoform X2 [Mastacembelus armatus]
MLLFQLPDDVFYHILSYLDCRSLSRLSQVCKSFYRFVNRDAVWRKIAKEGLNTGITRDGTDRYPHIPLKERVKIAQNWCDGICKKAVPLKWKTKLLPWLQLDGDGEILFLSQAANIEAYYLRQDPGKLQSNPFKIYSANNGDVCHFVLTDSHLISGRSDGKILIHSRTSDMLVELSGHNQEVNCLDSKDGLIISGSRDRTVRIWTLTSSCPKETISMYDRVWSVAISPTLSSFVTGTACCNNFSPLRIWDVERWWKDRCWTEMQIHIIAVLILSYKKHLFLVIAKTLRSVCFSSIELLYLLFLTGQNQIKFHDQFMMKTRRLQTVRLLFHATVLYNCISA